MTAKEIILLILGGVLANNMVFERLMGAEPAMLNGKCTRTALSVGIGTAVIMILSALITYPLQAALAEVPYLNVPAFIAVILILAYVLKLIVKKPMGIWFPLIALNSAVLGLCAGNVGSDFLTAILSAVGTGIGFIAAMLLFAGVKGRIDEKAVPPSFRGLPIYLVIAFIISLALTAYK